MANGRYYIGRVIKINLDQTMLMDAIINSPVVSIGKFDWTITDVEDLRLEGFPYIFGKMSKYAKEGHATVIDEVRRSQVDADVPNLLEASSSFRILRSIHSIDSLTVHFSAIVR